MQSILLLALLPCAFALEEGKHHHKHQHGLSVSEETVESIPVFKYKADCHKKRPVVLTQLAQQVYKKVPVPGTGMSPGDIEPFVEVLKDGFFETACIKDYMYLHGDAHGGNKHEYKLKAFSNVSIVHYKDIVPSEDQKKMDQEVCFEFCRTVPDMMFFGLIHGRDCYCAPYFKMMAGDSSQCDAVCEGKPTTMCGGMVKSSIFEMHLCADTAEDLANAGEKAADMAEKMQEDGNTALEKADRLQGTAATLQGIFGAGGDPVASDLCQEAKVFAGDVQHAAEDTIKLGAKLEELKGKVKALDGAKMTDAKTVKEAEALVKEIEKTLSESETSLETTQELSTLAGLNEEEGKGEGKEEPEEKKGGKDVLDTYMPTMFFVDQEFEKVPSTCGGDVVKKPMLGTALDCAEVCNSLGNECDAFNYFEGKDGLCVMFSKLKSIQYYTECGGKKKEFLQLVGGKKKESSQVIPTLHVQLVPEEIRGSTRCYAKFAHFTGMTLKPDPSGKCKQCLKTADKAQRCLENME